MYPGLILLLPFCEIPGDPAGPLLSYFKLTTLGIEANLSQRGQFSGCAGGLACLSSSVQDLC